MKHYLVIELKKALKNKLFIGSLIVGILITLISIYYMIGAFANFKDEINILIEYYGDGVNPTIQSSTLHNSWIGGEEFTLGYTIFFFVFPLLATIPYSWSFLLENQNGYIKNIVLRVDKKVYLISKYISTFVVGGLSVTIPLLFDFLIMGLIAPNQLPDLIYPYYTVFQGGFMSEIFYTLPVLYVLVYMFIIFIISGLIATISMSMAVFIKNKIVILITPFILLLIIEYIISLIQTNYEFSPLLFTHPTPIRLQHHIGIILGWTIIFFIISIGLLIIKERKNDIF